MQPLSSLYLWPVAEAHRHPAADEEEQWHVHFADEFENCCDQNNYDRIRAIESGYRNHKFPYIKTIDLGSKATKAAFRNGDVVALVSTLKNLDVTHMGIVKIAALSISRTHIVSTCPITTMNMAMPLSMSK